MKSLIYILSCLLFLANCKNKNPEKPFKEKTDIYSCGYGKSDAESDFRKGRLMLYIYGMPSPSSGEYWKILNKEYKVEIKGAVGCMITEAIHCYNDFMKVKIIEKYGKNVFDYASYKGDSIYYSNCETAKKLAQADFKKGKLMLFEIDDDNKEFYWRILTSEYHISKRTSDVLSQNNSYQCYNDFMEEKIKEKYGDDFFKEIYSKKTIYENSKVKNH